VDVFCTFRAMCTTRKGRFAMKHGALTFKMSAARLRIAQWARHFVSLFQRRGAENLLMLLLFGAAGLYLFANARKLLEFEWQLHPG